ncbi:ArnT family glycosyltransferase [Flexithrix dorotheae]|uniref:ArnT family glycosyltransferase n=1 Tax=Flexithrix dorotheae TaxID=70993 RepID=UPI0012F7351B|nr:glycosyltransferase family 39 protein [Flexithrix dorotheae]
MNYIMDHNKQKGNIWKIFKDFRFWILLYFFLRLIGITNPPLEITHNWRESIGTMVARNFLEIDANILYPRLDFNGNKEGIVGMEFPIYNYLIFLWSKIFGYSHFAGRFINLVVSSLGIFYFFRIIRIYINQKTAFFSGIILLNSVWFYYSRKIIPETFAASLVIIGLYFGLKYFYKNGNIFSFGLFTLLATLGVLSKISAICLLGVCIIPFLDKKVNRRKKITMVFGGFILSSLVGWWYFYWNPYLTETYAFSHFFMGVPITQAISDLVDNLGLFFKRFYDTALKYIGFFSFLFGLFWCFYKKEKLLIYIYISVSIFLLPIILKTGYNFAFHEYYIIPFVPVMALMAGYGLSSIPRKKVSVIILFFIALEGIINQQHQFLIKSEMAKLELLETKLDDWGTRGDLVAINCGYYPTPLYMAHRKGWITSNNHLKSKDYLLRLKGEGCRFFIILKKSFGTEVEQLPMEKVYSDEHFTIYNNSFLE